MKTKKRNNQDLTIIKATQGQFDTEGVCWTDRAFSHPERTIRVATSFSGIGAPEMALKRLGLKSKIVFACDIGERYLKYSYKQLAAFTQGLDAEKKKRFAEHLYEQNKAHIETLRAGQAKKGASVKPFTLEEVMHNLYKEVTDPKVVLELVKECLDMLTEGMTQAERETYIDRLYDQKGNNYIKDAFFANHTIDESSWHTDIRFMDATKYKGQVDLYVGGSPCQSYSRSGKRLGLEDTRGTLFYEFAKRIKECEPKVFIYENVKDMLSAGSGEMSGLEAALEVFSGLGYHLYWRVLNSKEYGIPQNRERVWVVGFKEEYTFRFPNQIPLTSSWREYLDKWDRVDLPYTRDLTGLESLRLMGFDDFTIPASLQALDEKQRDVMLCAFAGNSMVVECLMALFRQMDITQYGAAVEDTIRTYEKENRMDDSLLEQLSVRELSELIAKASSLLSRKLKGDMQEEIAQPAAGITEKTQSKTTGASISILEDTDKGQTTDAATECEEMKSETEPCGEVGFPFLEHLFNDTPATAPEVLKVRMLDPMDLSGKPAAELIKVGATKLSKSAHADSQWDRVYSLDGICPCLTKTGRVKILVTNGMGIA